MEDKLLLQAIRTDGASDTAEQMEALLGKPLDWEYILQKAMRHGVMPLLYHNLSKPGLQQAVPKGTFEKLRKIFHRNALHNLSLSQELLKILDVFKERSIAAVPYKGPALAAAIYGDISLRQSSDLDILIKEHDLPGAREVLLSRGYRPDPIRQLDYEAHFIRQDKGFVVDLHWAISSKNTKKEFYV